MDLLAETGNSRSLEAFENRLEAPCHVPRGRDVGSVTSPRSLLPCYPLHKALNYHSNIQQLGCEPQL